MLRKEPPASLGRNPYQRHGYWIAFAGLLAIAASRRTNSTSLLIVGLGIAAFGIVLGLWTGRGYLATYVRQMVPDGSVSQSDPFARAQAAVPAGVFSTALTYRGTTVWPGGITRGSLLDVSEWGLRVRAGRLSPLLSRKQAAWQLPWASITSVEMAQLPAMGGAPTPVKVLTREPSSVFLFFTARPDALIQVVSSRLTRAPAEAPPANQ